MAQDNNKFAVIRTGGKQYKVSEGDVLEIEKIDVEEGKSFDISNVLLYSKDDKIDVGAPTIKDVKVKAKVLSQFKDDKVTVFKYKKRKNYRVKKGHRQRLTKIEIEKIGS